MTAQIIGSELRTQIKRIMRDTPLTAASMRSDALANRLINEVIAPCLAEQAETLQAAKRIVDESTQARAEVEELNELIEDKQALLRTLHILVLHAT